MNPVRTLAVAATLLLLLLPVLAVAHNYTNVEGGFLDRDIDGNDDAGVRIAGSAGIAPPVALFGEYSDTDDFDQLSAGALFHTPLNNVVDLNLGASFETVDTRRRDESGVGLRAGLRWKLPDARFELNPEIRYVDVFSENTSLRVAGLFRLQRDLDLQAAVQGGDEDRIELGLRYNFGPKLTGP